MSSGRSSFASSLIERIAIEGTPDDCASATISKLSISTASARAPRALFDSALATTLARRIELSTTVAPQLSPIDRRSLRARHFCLRRGSFRQDATRSQDFSDRILFGEARPPIPPKCSEIRFRAVADGIRNCERKPVAADARQQNANVRHRRLEADKVRAIAELTGARTSAALARGQIHFQARR